MCATWLFSHCLGNPCYRWLIWRVYPNHIHIFCLLCRCLLVLAGGEFLDTYSAAAPVIMSCQHFASSLLSVWPGKSSNTRIFKDICLCSTVDLSKDYGAGKYTCKYVLYRWWYSTFPFNVVVKRTFLFSTTGRWSCFLRASFALESG